MIIRREDFGKINKLTSGSHKKIWFICDNCNIGVLQAYRNYLNQNNGKFCRRCRNKHTANRIDVKEKQSINAKKLWNNPLYREKTSKSLSIACQKAWDKDDGSRRKNLSINNPMKNKDIVKKQSESEATPEEELKKICEQYNYEYLGRELQKRGGVVVIFKCDKGHLQRKRLDVFRRGSYRCNICFASTSIAEKEIFDFVKSLNFDIIRNDRKIIKPYELDIVISSKKIAIEYCGLYWHSENKGKDKNYHLNKLKLCNNKGYKLITIFEDEWLNKQKIVKLRLKHILGINDKSIYARKCNIIEIDTKLAKQFIEKYHIQGYTGSLIKLGAFYSHKLVAVMTFAKPSISKGKKNIENVYELSRFCTSNFVIGISGKLLKHFQRNYKWNIIYSYADRRWSDGNVYNKIGFEFINFTKPNYFYFKTDNIRRYHRFNFRKNVLNEKLNNFNKNKTEWQNMLNNGWYRIWDCGNYLFEIKRN